MLSDSVLSEVSILVEFFIESCGPVIDLVSVWKLFSNPTQRIIRLLPDILERLSRVAQGTTSGHPKFLQDPTPRVGDFLQTRLGGGFILSA